MTARDLQDMAAGLQDVTTFGDEVTPEMQSILLTFTNLNSDVFPRASELILDIATRMGGDNPEGALKGAAVQVGKALNDPIKNLSALAESGIQFTASQIETIKSLVESNQLFEAQTIILDELEKLHCRQAELLR